MLLLTHSIQINNHLNEVEFEGTGTADSIYEWLSPVAYSVKLETLQNLSLNESFKHSWADVGSFTIRRFAFSAEELTNAD